MTHNKVSKVKDRKIIMFRVSHCKKDGNNRNSMKNSWSRLGKCGINSQVALPKCKRTRDSKGKLRRHRRKKKKIRRKTGSKRKLLVRIYLSNFVNKPKKEDSKHSKGRQSWSRSWKNNK